MTTGCLYWSHRHGARPPSPPRRPARPIMRGTAHAPDEHHVRTNHGRVESRLKHLVTYVTHQSS
nr:MAG TPA: hypothetical protein [Caudoviricetes sp.]